MKSVNVIFFRVLSGVLACFFFTVAPVIILAAEGWQKLGAVPGVLLGILFLILNP